MSIDVVLGNNPSGDKRASVSIEGFWIYNLLPKPDDTNFCLLKYVDPFGSTFFNQLQLPDLILEWRRLYDRAESEEQLEFLQRVEELLQSRRGQYVHFWGD